MTYTLPDYLNALAVLESASNHISLEFRMDMTRDELFPQMESLPITQAEIDSAIANREVVNAVGRRTYGGE